MINARRARLAATLPLENRVLLVGAGKPIPLPEGSDQTYPFRSHSEYYYLTGEECAGGVIGFDPAEGSKNGWVSFVPNVTEAERIWEGRTQAVGTSLDELPSWLSLRSARGVVQLGAGLPDVVSDDAAADRVRQAFTHTRRIKDAHEVDLIRRAAAATAAGYRRLQEIVRTGVTERTLQIELEAAFFNAGGSRTGFGSIVGSGPNSAVLHVEPSARVIEAGDFILVDAGAEIDRYMADVTRTYVAGTPTEFQRDLYQCVLSAQEKAIGRCRAGTEWKQIHLRCAVDLVSGLVEMGVMRGHAESLVEAEAHTLFFPHGLGHMVGLGVRDGSGLYPGRSKDPRPSLRNLRLDLPLEAGYVVTVEPGLYFIPPLLNDPARRARYKEVVNWRLVEQHLQLGGVRIEDNLLVTTGAPEVLTAAIPKQL